MKNPTKLTPEELDLSVIRVGKLERMLDSMERDSDCGMDRIQQVAQNFCNSLDKISELHGIDVVVSESQLFSRIGTSSGAKIVTGYNFIDKSGKLCDETDLPCAAEIKEAAETYRDAILEQNNHNIFITGAYREIYKEFLSMTYVEPMAEVDETHIAIMYIKSSLQDTLVRLRLNLISGIPEAINETDYSVEPNADEIDAMIYESELDFANVYYVRHLSEKISGDEIFMYVREELIAEYDATHPDAAENRDRIMNEFVDGVTDVSLNVSDIDLELYSPPEDFVHDPMSGGIKLGELSEVEQQMLVLGTAIARRTRGGAN